MNSVRVRMFRQGLGDCFLLSFPGKERDSHVLIDFGVLLGTANAAETMRRIAQHILDATSGHLDVLVATHEHWDHVSGFAQAQELLGSDKLSVGEVWMAWTEKPDDAQAREMGKRRHAALQRLIAARHRLAAASNDPGAARTANRLDGLLEFWGGLGAAGRRTTRDAMQWVRDRTHPKPPLYLEPGMSPLVVPGAGEAVRVYVLGPPRDTKWLKKSDPTKRASEVYELRGDGDAGFGLFSAIDALATGGTPGGQPFEDWFRVGDDDARRSLHFKRHYFAGDPARQIEHDWLGPVGPLALQLDSDTNNTSLVLAFELLPSGRVLLFPGDAQVGNWLSWQEIHWTVQEQGRSRTVDSTDLLARTVLYKVGHHGSHNATLREFGLELMTNTDLAAMLPVDRVTARKMKWDMPFQSLHSRLEEHSKGRILDLELGLAAVRPEGTSAEEWKRFEQHCTIEDDWIDYRIDT